MWSQEFLFNMFLCFLLGSPTPCALKVADKIAEQFDNAVLLMVRKTSKIVLSAVSYLLV